MDYQLTVTSLVLAGNRMTFSLSGVIHDPALADAPFLSQPKVVLYFENGQENRRIPLPLREVSFVRDRCEFAGQYTYMLEHIYWTTARRRLPGTLRLILSYGNEYVEGAAFSLAPDALETDDRSYLLTPAEGFFHIRQKPQTAVRRSFAALAAAFGSLFYLLTYCIGLCLLPWFLLEALLSFCGATKLDPRVKTQNPLRRVIGHVNQRISRFSYRKVTLYKAYRQVIRFIFACFCLLPVKKNRVTFISMRRSDLSGNFAFVHEQLKDDPALSLRFILCYRPNVLLPPLTLLRFCHACAVSKVIVLDEYTPQIHFLDLRKPTRLIQLWHACGAFKTFGFTRLGKPAGSPQPTRNHRSYDYVTVSSTYCKRCHSEGFGISDEKVVPTGIPRTDVFFSDEYKQKARQDFFARYPAMQGKKILLFAPTFRGTVKETAYYPVERLDVGALLRALGPDYALIIKHHPFVPQTQPVPEDCRDRVVDLSASSELNDLLFVCHAVITDYSSLIFEAALLKLPMLFYVFDLRDYVRDRDFYFDLPRNAPGRLVYTQQELTDAIKREDFDSGRMDAFAKLFFDQFDGQSTARVAALIQQAQQE